MRGVETLAEVLDHLAECAVGHVHGSYIMVLSGDSVSRLYAELNRLQAAEERLNLARQVLVEDGYFTEDQVGDDLAPRLIEWLMAHRGRMTASTRVEIDDEVLWQRVLPRLETWFGKQLRHEMLLMKGVTAQ